MQQANHGAGGSPIVASPGSGLGARRVQMPAGNVRRATLTAGIFLHLLPMRVWIVGRRVGKARSTHVLRNISQVSKFISQLPPSALSH